MPAKKKRTMQSLLGARVTATTTDGASLTGRLLGFDRHLNVILGDAEHTRRTKRAGKLERKAVGFVVVRGESVVNVSVSDSVATAAGHVDELLTASELAKVREAAEKAAGGAGAAEGAGFKALSAAAKALRGPVAGLE